MMKTKKKKNTDKEFGLSSWAINNKTTMYVLIAVFFYLGVSAFFNMPRENFPEVNETKIYVSTIYPGNTAEDIEKLVIDPLEDKLKTVSNVVEITSTSQEDYSIVVVEFDENISGIVSSCSCSVIAGSSDGGYFDGESGTHCHCGVFVLLSCDFFTGDKLFAALGLCSVPPLALFAESGNKNRKVCVSERFGADTESVCEGFGRRTVVCFCLSQQRSKSIRHYQASPNRS